MLTYELVVETEPQANVVRLRLKDRHGVHRGSQQIRLAEHSAAKWEGLFDTRQYVVRYQGSLLDGHGQVATADGLLEELGVFLGEVVLGPEILGVLLEDGMRQRALLVRVPASADDVLAAAFARTPWEIARSSKGAAPLMQRNVVVRVTTEAESAGDSATGMAARESAVARGVVRVLLVLAEAPGSRPLAMRLEREELCSLFEEEILPHRNVEIDMLCHGVTRGVLRERIKSRNGYHVVHWSGHGSHNRLEIVGEDGRSIAITGEALVELFAEAGGFIPQLFFLSACLSGTLVEKGSWEALQRALRGEEPEVPAGETKVRSLSQALELGNAPGYTGTALALLRSGVPQVVAMRYSVGDDYARELARWFYKRLLADEGQPSTEAALALARGDVWEQGSARAKRMPVDHANPLVFGRHGRWLDPTERRSPQLKKLRPKPQPLLPGGSRELEPPAFFVGRGAALTKVNRAWQKGGAAVTVVQGMAGLGKTTITAEAIHLWHGRFKWVLAFQAKPTELTLEEFLRQVDLRLSLASTTYRERCEEAPNDRVYLEPGKPLRGQARYEKLRDNLVEALRDEAVLLVLDNFEGNLEGVQSEGGYACKDPQWDALLGVLARELPRTRSRLVITTRHRPKALLDEAMEWLALGPLPAEEAVLFVRSHERLSRLLEDDEGRGLVEQLLRVGRGHPFILDRLAGLVGDRKVLGQELARLEREGLGKLPELTATMTKEQAEAERKYLEDVAVGSVDFLLERVSAGARRLLWVVTLAFEAVSEGMLAEVWSGVLGEPAELLPLLRELYQAGLVTREESVPSRDVDEAAIATVVFHELVRERIAAWMDAHPDERGPRTAAQVWVGYGQRYGALFESLHMSGRHRAREASPEVGRRALVYLVRAGDLESLESFAGRLVTGISDPRTLAAIAAELRTVAEHVPTGKVRWSVWGYLAGALTNSTRPNEAIPLLEAAAAEAEQVEDWDAVAWICGTWAVTLAMVGQLDASKGTQFRCAEANRKAGRPRVHVIMSELEALRIDVMQGQALEALSGINARLQDLRDWWKAHLDNEPVPDAPDRDFLARTLVCGLNIATQANLDLERSQESLHLLEETEEVERAMGESEYVLAIAGFNKYSALLQLGRIDDAQVVLEKCLTQFHEAGDPKYESKALSGLAQIWATRYDLQQAADLQRQALVLCNRVPAPGDRAIAHNNLANYLGGLGQVEAVATHRLAALTYILVSKQRRLVSIWVRNLTNTMRMAAIVGAPYDLPRLADILSLPSFDALSRFLIDNNVNSGELQAEIDHISAQATQAVLAHPALILTELPPEFRKLLAPLFQAAAEGQDVDLILANLRAQLVQDPYMREADIEVFLDFLRAIIPTP